MRARIGLAAALAIASLAMRVMAMGQGPEGGPPHGGPGAGRDGFRILGAAGGHPGKVVTGAPFSGKETSTDTQTLGNGTHISHSGTVQIYRDASGRTRTERTFTGVGPWSSGEPKTIIDIFDPVAGVAYFLNPVTQTATKRTLPKPPAQTSGASSPVAGPAPPALPGETTTTSQGEAATVAGVACTPTTTVRTIAANTFGNDQALTITETRCYSAELQLNLSVTRTDPRMGNMTSSFETLTPGAPDPSLFAPPAGYTVTAATERRARRLPGQGEDH